MVFDVVILMFTVFFIINNSLLFFSVVFPQKITAVKKEPAFTVIIANADSGGVLGKTLSSIRNADYPQKKVEIIVVDSTGTKAVAASARKHKARLIKDTVACGKGAALNIGIKKAKNEILYFLDSDTFIERDALENIAKSISKETPAVQGIFLPVNKAGISSLMARMATLLHAVPNFYASRFFKTSYVSGRNFAIYRNVLLGMGGFGAVLTEDLELTRRLYEEKVRVLFNQNVKSKELVPVKLSHMWKQQQRWASGGITEIAKFIKADFISFVFLFPFLIATVLFYVFAIVFGMLYVITGSIFAFSGMITSFIVVLYKALKYLTKTEIILLPFITAMLSFFTLAVISSVLVKMLLGIKIDWYRTPKYLEK